LGFHLSSFLYSMTTKGIEKIASIENDEEQNETQVCTSKA